MKLTEFFESKGYSGREGVEEAKAELERRRHELQKVRHHESKGML